MRGRARALPLSYLPSPASLLCTDRHTPVSPYAGRTIATQPSVAAILRGLLHVDGDFAEPRFDPHDERVVFTVHLRAVPQALASLRVAVGDLDLC